MMEEIKQLKSMVCGRVVVEFGPNAPQIISNTLATSVEANAKPEINQELGPVDIIVRKTSVTVWPEQPHEDWRQNRSFTNVLQVMHEYINGVGEIPPVQLLESNYGSRWRKSVKDRQFWVKRKHVYEAVQ